MNNNFTNNPNNSIRQNIERIMREKGLLPEQQVLHTEIGDFHYYPDNNAAVNTYNQPLPEYNATAAHNYQLRPQPNQQMATTATPQDFGMANSATATAMQNYAPNAFATYKVPELSINKENSLQHSQKNNNTLYDKFIKSDAYNQLRDFHSLQEGYKRTIDQDGLVFPYPDINGEITGCIGHNMKTDFLNHPWIDKKSEHVMTNAQIYEEESNLKKLPADLKPELYAVKTNARLYPEYCENLYNSDIESRWQTLNNKIPNWEYMSPELQAATMDVHFTGNMAPKNSWTLAKNAAMEMNKNNYCKNLHRNDTNRQDIEERNKWVLDMCNKGRFYK